MNIIERIKTNFKKNWIGIAIISVIWVVVACVVLTSYKPTLGVESFGSESYSRGVLELDKNTELVANVPIEEGSHSVSILFATYARKNNGSIHINIEGTSSKTVYVDKDIDMKDIDDNAYLSLRLNERLKLTDRRINVTLTSTGETGSSVGVYFSNNNVFENSNFYVNGEDQQGLDLMVRYLVDNDAFRSFSNTLIVSMIAGLTVLMYFALIVDPKREVLFALSAFILGMIFMIVIVPMSPPDEQTHYEIALQVSNKMMGVKDNLIDSIYLKYGSMYGHYNISAGYGRFMREIFGPLKLTGKMMEPAGSLEGRYLVPYYPIALGITIGRLTGLNMITMFYLARLFNLLLYVACVYIAVKNIPGYKFLLGLLMIMPMMVQTSIAITYDAFVIGLSYISFAFFVKWFFSDKEIPLWEIIFIMIVSAGLAPAKVVYCFLAFAFWFVPKKSYGNLKRKIICCIIICIPAIVSLYGIMAAPLTFMIQKLLKGTNTMSVTLSETKDLIIANINKYDLNGYRAPEGVTINTILKYPGQVMEIFYRTVRYRIKTWFYGSLGRSLSGDTLILPINLVHIMVGIVLASLFIKEDIALPWWIRVLSIVMCVVIGIYILVGFFLSWTGVDELLFDSHDAEVFGGRVVEGIQGRYFSPILPYFFLLFQHKKFGLTKNSEKYLYSAYLMIFFVVVIYVLSYTFVN